MHRQVQIAMTPEARQWILEKTCGDRNYGARPLRRALQKYVEDPLSEALIQGGLQTAGDAGSFSLRRRPGVPSRRGSNPGGPLGILHARAGWEHVRRGSKKSWAGDCGLDQNLGRKQENFSARIRMLGRRVFAAPRGRCNAFAAQQAGPARTSSTSSSALNSSAIAGFSATRCSRAFFRARAIPTIREAVRRDFQALWNTQFFEDIRLEVEDSPDQPERENRHFLRDRAADHPPHRVQGQQVDHANRTFSTPSRTRRSACRSKASSIPRRSSAPKW